MSTGQVDFKAGARSTDRKLFDLYAGEEMYRQGNQLMQIDKRMEGVELQLPRLVARNEGDGNRLNGVKKIAVLVSNDLRDFIFSLPALNALRLTYPEAEIILLGHEWHCQFLAGRPGPVNRVEILPPAALSGEMRTAEMVIFFERMAEEQIDLAIQMAGDGQIENPILLNLGARLTAGSQAPEAQPLGRSLPYSYYQLGVLHYLEIASLVGALPVALEPTIPLTRADLYEADRLLPPGKQPLVVLAPGARDQRLRWPSEKFAAVGSALTWSGAQVVLAGIADDAADARAVSDLMPAGAENLCGQLSPGGLAGLFSRARAVISNDTGMLSLANAAGTSTVGIYWCGRLLNGGPVTGARHRITISWQMICPACGMNATRSDCGHQESFVADISQDEVTAAALEFLYPGQADGKAMDIEAKYQKDEQDAELSIFPAVSCGV